MIELSSDQLDALKEIVNIGVGQAAASLNEMLESHIALEVPEIIILDPEKPDWDMAGLCDEELACVRLDFKGLFNGRSALVFPAESAAKLVSTLTGEEAGSGGLDGLMAGTLNEVGNIVMNGVIGSIANILDKPLSFSLPNYLEGKLAALMARNTQEAKVAIMLVRTNFKIEKHMISGYIILIFELDSFDHLILAMNQLSQPT